MNHWTGFELALERWSLSLKQAMPWLIKALFFEAKKRVIATKIKANKRFSDVGISSLLR